jgi:dimethylargininase
LTKIKKKNPLEIFLQRIEREASFSYQTLTVPEDCAANVLSVNGTLIHRSAQEAPETCKMLASKSELQRREVAVSELAKVGSGLSSLCLLVRRTRAARTF